LKVARFFSRETLFHELLILKEIMLGMSYSAEQLARLEELLSVTGLKMNEQLQAMDELLDAEQSEINLPIKWDVLVNLIRR
jgi:hypothetical protein